MRVKNKRPGSWFLIPKEKTLAENKVVIIIATLFSKLKLRIE